MGIFSLDESDGHFLCSTLGQLSPASRKDPRTLSVFTQVPHIPEEVMRCLSVHGAAKQLCECGVFTEWHAGQLAPEQHDASEGMVQPRTVC